MKNLTGNSIVRVPIILENRLTNFKNAGQSVYPNDSLGKNFPQLQNDWKNNIEQEQEWEIPEKERGQQVATIQLAVRIVNEADDFLREKILNNSFDVFDRQVLAACIAEQLFGNKITTVNAVWKNMSGETREPKPEMRSKILWSVEKMSLIRFRISLKEAFEKLQSLRKRKLHCTSKLEYVGYLLPCEIAPAVINNVNVVDAIKFLEETPLLYEYASWKKQAYTIPSNLLPSPSVRNTELGMTLKSYILLRINEMKRSGNSNASSILLNSIIQYCNGNPEDRKLRKRVRDNTHSYLLELKDKQEIIDFSLVNEDGVPCELKNCVKFIVKVEKFSKKK